MPWWEDGGLERGGAYKEVGEDCFGCMCWRKNEGYGG